MEISDVASSEVSDYDRGGRVWYRSNSTGRLNRISSTSSMSLAVSHLTVLNDSVFLNEEWLRNCTKNLGQVIIVDCGCPRGLMGDVEYERLKEMVEVKEITVKEEGFRFGPSRVYNSNKKVKFSMRVGMNQTDCEFFVVNGKVPILLGNDFMAPHG